jgi:putative hydrolase of the HAD superfamily
VIAAEIQSPFASQKVCSIGWEYSVPDPELGKPPPALTRAVFLDALGTLVELEPPWVLLRERVPDEIGDGQLVAAVRAEMDYYKAHAHEGRDAESLADLRERCARVLSDELGAQVTVEELVDAVRMRAYPDAEPALAALRDAGVARVVVSNWDCSLGSVLERCGLAGLLDGAVSSAEAGARKPDPEIFAPALEIAGCERGEALHVGDTPEEDVAGARAAGIRALLIDRRGGGEISSLTEIVEHL